MRVIGITGGIGSGKSVVSRILRLQGFRVYDCDYEAKCLMTDSPSLRSEIVEILGEEAYLESGMLNKSYMAARIFSEVETLERINKAVHGAVRSDLELRLEGIGMLENADIMEYRIPENLFFVESAILGSSGLDDICQSIWVVTAPESLRLERVMSRGGISEEDALRRIETQKMEESMLPKEKIQFIDNSGGESILSRISQLVGLEREILELDLSEWL